MPPSFLVRRIKARANATRTVSQAAKPALPIGATATPAPAPFEPSGIRAANTAIAPALDVNEANFCWNGHYLTDEQQTALELALTGESVKIEAGAGAGKTSTLAAISAAQSDKRGLYIAFNKAIANDAAASFPSNVTCKTAHALAFQAMKQHYGSNFSDRFNARLTSGRAVEVLNVDVKAFNTTHSLLGLVLLAWVSRFEQSGDDAIAINHAPWSDLKMMSGLEDDKAAYAKARELARNLEHYAKRLWDLMTDPQSSVPISHDTYLKLWSLGKPSLSFYDFILFDEAQDASGVMLAVIQQQTAQVIWVGDRRQQIYSWRGAVNAMDKIVTAHSCAVTRSFRYGQPIAAVANAVLREFLDSDFRVNGSPFVDSRIGYCARPNAVLCRTNGTCIAELMRYLAAGLRPAIVGGVGSLIAEIQSAKALMRGETPALPQFQVFDSWSDLVQHSQTWAGSDLSSLVRMLEKWDIKELLDALSEAQYVSEKRADVVISTVHRAKGREWDSVRLADDFAYPSREGMKKSPLAFSEEEANLLYVAVTRAKISLDILHCTAALLALGES